MDWTPAFLAALRKTGNVSEAARRAKIERKTAYLKRDSDEAFKADWDDALEEAADELEAEARKRAKQGSDTLLIFLLKGLKPEKFRENSRIQLDAQVRVTWEELMTGDGDENNNASDPFA